VIRVLSIIHYPIFGGPHNRNAHVAPLLSKENFETTVLLPSEPGNAAERLRRGGVVVVTIPLVRLRAKFNPLYHLKFLLKFIGDVQRIRYIIREREIDVVQINGLVNPQGALAAHLEGVSVVWQILDTFSPMSLRRLVMPLVKWLADVVMCTGKQVAIEHPGAIDFGERLVLFYPPVDISKFINSPDRRLRARELLGVTKEAFIVGTVGNINPQKGHLTFIQAAARLKLIIPNVHFVILGALYDNHKEYAERLWREADVLGIKKGIDLSVLDPDVNVADLEPAFDVFWMTSAPRSEGIPTATEEAMALGIPVIATQVGSIGEIVSEGETGFVVPPFDITALAEKTEQLYSNEGMISSMNSASREFAVQNFSEECCAQSHKHAYELALLSNKKRQNKSNA
jgi:glycosyltransferase involved in cell wall biosynthesis